MFAQNTLITNEKEKARYGIEYTVQYADAYRSSYPP